MGFPGSRAQRLLTPRLLGACGLHARTGQGMERRALPWAGELNRDVVHWTLMPEELADSPAGSATYEAFDDLERVLLPGD